jgi:Protein of unknown function (DUF2744)
MTEEQQIPVPDSFTDNALPTIDNCDPDNPYQMFLWCFVALPMVSGAPLIMPIDYYQLVSKRLYDLGIMRKCRKCGFSIHPTLKYVPPQQTNPNMWYSPGSWEPVE